MKETAIRFIVYVAIKHDPSVPKDCVRVEGREGDVILANIDDPPKQTPTFPAIGYANMDTIARISAVMGREVQ